MKKSRVAFFTLLAAASLINLPFSQEKPCSKPKLYIRVGINEQTWQQLIRDYPFDTIENWLDKLCAEVAKDIQQAAGDVEIIPLEKTVFKEDKPETPKEENAFNERVKGEYHFDLMLAIIEAKGSSHPNYWAVGSIGAADPGGTYLSVELYENSDVYKAILSEVYLVAKRGLADLIERYERTHFATLRDPKLTMNAARDWVSPEPGERKVRITVKAVDCRGLSGKGTIIHLTKDTQRGTLNDTPRGTSGWTPSDSGEIAAATVSDGTVEFEYELKNGVDSGMETIRALTIGKGYKVVRQAVVFSIKGLGLEVAPSRTPVAPGEETRIRIRLFKTDVSGGKEPLPGRKVKVTVEGLKDGQVTPRDEVTTDDAGEATLTYKAGGEEKNVKFMAKYQPEGFSGFVQKEATVQVVPPEYDLMLRLETHITQNGDCTEIHRTDPAYTEKGSTSGELQATWTATFKLTHTSRERDEIQERYETTAPPLLSFFLTRKARQETVFNSGRRSLITWTEEVLNPQLVYKQQSLELRINKDGLMMRSATWGAQPVEFKWRRTTTADGREHVEEWPMPMPAFQFFPGGTFAPGYGSWPFGGEEFPIPGLRMPVSSLVAVPMNFGDRIHTMGGNTRRHEQAHRRRVFL